jgi:signal transduction histidine kinase
MKHYLRLFYLKFIAGKSEDEDARRRELILNTILCGLFLLSTTALLSSLAFEVFAEQSYISNTITACLNLTILSLVAWIISAAGKSAISALLLLSILSMEAIQISLAWSFELASVQLIAGLCLAIAGLVLSRKNALIFSIVFIALLFGLGQFEVSQGLEPDMTVTNEKLEISDNVNYNLALTLFVVLSWLSNSEIIRSLKRSNIARAELAYERDTLELKVIERTKQMEELQLERTLELQRFAEFGRLSAHLLHDLSNPLTAASLHLQLIDGQKSKAYRQAKQNIAQIERYVSTARKQLQSVSDTCEFDANEEIKQLCSIIQPLAENVSVALHMYLLDIPRIHGDPVKFHQIMSNLVVNAIDACADHNTGQTNSVSIFSRSAQNCIDIEVRDTGEGISESDLPKIFEPFYSTKTTSGRGLGIGLSMVKNMVEKDFSAQIKVSSKAGEGATFRLLLPPSPIPAAYAQTNPKSKHETIKCSSLTPIPTGGELLAT